jgi:hypothetical protein
MRVVCVLMLAGFTVGSIIDCIEASCFLCSESVEVGVLEGVRDHLEIVHAPCFTSDWVFLVLRKVDKGIGYLRCGLVLIFILFKLYYIYILLNIRILLLNINIYLK